MLLKYIYLIFALPLFFTDLTKLVLSNKLISGLLLSGLLVNYYKYNSQYYFQYYFQYNYILGIIFGYFILYFLYWSYYFFTKKEGIGRGDIKLLAALGAWFGIFSLPILLFYASIFGIIYFCFINYIFSYIFEINKTKYIPFGSCLLLVGFLFML